MSRIDLIGCGVWERGGKEIPVWYWPEWNGQNEIIGIAYRNLIGDKKVLGGGKRGLVLPRNWETGPEPLLNVEGFSDCVSQLAAGNNCTARPSKSLKPASVAAMFAAALNQSRHQIIIIVADRDDASESGNAAQVAAILACQFPDRKFYWAATPDGAKDSREWLTGRPESEDWPTRGRAFLDALQLREPPAVALPLHKPPAVANGQQPKLIAPQTPGLLDEHLTDVGNARRLVQLHGAKLRYCHPWDKWLVWDGMRWREDDIGELQRMAKDTCCSLLQVATSRMGELARTGTATKEEIEGLQKIQMFALHSESAKRIAAMELLARSEPGIPILPEALNTNQWLLCCPNGTLDLRTGTLREHRREDYITQLCPTPFDPAALCTTFARFMEDVLGSIDLIRHVQKFMGYSLTGSVSEQVLPILYGTGGNGKTTLLNVWLSVMGSDYAGKAPTSMMVAHRGEHHPTELAGLFGKRLVVASETENGARLSESTVKELTGGDRISARRMREDFWEFDPTHKLILSTNYKPNVRGRDHAIWRRLRLFPFARRFEGAEKDKSMPTKLAAESPGILAWMVRGCLDWQRNGLGESEEVKTATAEYRSTEDVISTWISESCKTGDNGLEAPLSNLFKSYQHWAESSGEVAA